MWASFFVRGGAGGLAFLFSVYCEAFLPTTSAGIILTSLSIAHILATGLKRGKDIGIMKAIAAGQFNENQAISFSIRHIAHMAVVISGLLVGYFFWTIFSGKHTSVVFLAFPLSFSIAVCHFSAEIFRGKQKLIASSLLQFYLIYCVLILMSMILPNPVHTILIACVFINTPYIIHAIFIRSKQRREEEIVSFEPIVAVAHGIFLTQIYFTIIVWGPPILFFSLLGVEKVALYNLALRTSLFIGFPLILFNYWLLPRLPELLNPLDIKGLQYFLNKWCLVSASIAIMSIIVAIPLFPIIKKYISDPDVYRFFIILCTGQLFYILFGSYLNMVTISDEFSVRTVLSILGLSALSVAIVLGVFVITRNTIYFSLAIVCGYISPSILSYAKFLRLGINVYRKID